MRASVSSSAIARNSDRVEPSREYSTSTPYATSANAIVMRMCHVHHDASQLRPTSVASAGFGEQHERGQHREQHHRRSLQVLQEVDDRRAAEQHRGRHHEARRSRSGAARPSAVRRAGGHRASDHTAHTANKTNTRAEQQRRVRARRPVASRAGRNADATAGITASVSPTGDAEHEAGVRHVDEHRRRAERVQPEEAGGDEERQRRRGTDRASSCRRASSAALIASTRADERGDEHEPEVRPLVLPHEGVVDLRPPDQHPETDQRQRDVHEPHERSRREMPGRHEQSPQAHRAASGQASASVCCEPTGRFSAPIRPIGPISSRGTGCRGGRGSSRSARARRRP